MKETKIGNTLVTQSPEVHNTTYIYIKPELRGVKGCVDKTIEIRKDIYIDLDKDGEVVGIEIL